MGNGQAVYPCALRIASGRPNRGRWIDTGLRARVLVRERVRRGFRHCLGRVERRGRPAGPGPFSSAGSRSRPRQAGLRNHQEASLSGQPLGSPRVGEWPTIASFPRGARAGPGALTLFSRLAPRDVHARWCKNAARGYPHEPGEARSLRSCGWSRANGPRSAGSSNEWRRARRRRSRGFVLPAEPRMTYRYHYDRFTTIVLGRLTRDA